MGLEIQKVTDRGDVIRVPLTASPKLFAYTRVCKFISGTLAGGDVDSYESIFQNPESVPILVFRVVVNETVAAGVGGGEYVIIGTDADGTGMTGTAIMDGFDANTTGWYDNAYGPVALGSTAKVACVHMAANGGALDYLTAQYKVQDCSALAATVYVFYFPLE